MATNPPSLRTHLHPPAPRRGLGLALAGTVGLAAMTAATVIQRPAPHPPGDPCALPSGMALDALDAADRSWAVHRAVACRDLTAGRITAAEYRAVVAALDHPPTPPSPPTPREPLWASRVVGMSSEWSTDAWSAARVLGPPDVRNPGTDDDAAWASREADAPTEWIEVALPTPTRLTGIDVIESYNPGALSAVELITASGARRTVFAASATGPTGAYRRAIGFACTAEPIAAIRVTLASAAVAGWNELDAIGGRPCP